MEILNVDEEFVRRILVPARVWKPGGNDDEMVGQKQAVVGLAITPLPHAQGLSEVQDEAVNGQRSDAILSSRILVPLDQKPAPPQFAAGIGGRSRKEVWQPPQHTRVVISHLRRHALRLRNTIAWREL